MIEMLTAGTRPIISSQRQPSPLIRVNRHSSSSKEPHKKNGADIYSFRDEIHEDFNIKSYDDPYSWLDPSPDIYSSNLTATDPEKVASTSTNTNSCHQNPTNPYHNRYLTSQQLHWWGLQTVSQRHVGSHTPRLRLTQYHEDMLQKEKEEKEYQERVRNHEWLHSLQTLSGKRPKSKLAESGTNRKECPRAVSRDRGTLMHSKKISFLLDSSKNAARSSRWDLKPLSSTQSQSQNLSSPYGPSSHSDHSSANSKGGKKKSSRRSWSNDRHSPDRYRQRDRDRDHRDKRSRSRHRRSRSKSRQRRSQSRSRSYDRRRY